MKQRISILLIEDSSGDAGLILRQLDRNGFETEAFRVEDADNLRGALARQPWDLILCDYSLPDFTGMEALQIVQERQLDIPFIFVSGAMGEDVAVEAMRAGAHDYVLKQNLGRLAPAVERELREAAMRRSHRESEHLLKLRTKALEATANAVMIARRDGVIEWVNQAFTALTGYTAAEVAGQTPRFLKSGQHSNEFYADLWNTILLGQVWRGELINRRKDGSLYQEEQTITPVHDEQGEIAYFVSVHLDITERRRLESEFRQAQKMEAIGQLAGGVAHDFNNILAAMMMQTDLLEMTGELSREMKEGLQQIRASAESAAKLTRQLLLFSRRQVLQQKDLDLNELVTNLVKMLQRIIGEDIRLQLDLFPSALFTHADPGMLEQIVMNLAVNARDAMPEGGRLIIETSEKIVDETESASYPELLPGRYVRLNVTDTGVGIPSEVLPRIFEPFFTTKEPGKGTGLGLATVFGIVKQHRGLVAVTSRVGKGASFEILLPACPIDAQASSLQEPRPAPRGGHESLLLVEDEENLRMTIRLLLEHYGYRVFEAGNGVEALRVWADHRGEVALLITDLVMPAGMTGQQLARRLQTDSPRLKTVFTSGYSPAIAGRHLELNPGEKFLQKPFEGHQLLEMVRNSLDGEECKCPC